MRVLRRGLCSRDLCSRSSGFGAWRREEEEVEERSRSARPKSAALISLFSPHRHSTARTLPPGTCQPAARRPPSPPTTRRSASELLTEERARFFFFFFFRAPPACNPRRRTPAGAGAVVRPCPFSLSLARADTYPLSVTPSLSPVSYPASASAPPNAAWWNPAQQGPGFSPPPPPPPPVQVAQQRGILTSCLLSIAACVGLCCCLDEACDFCCWCC